MAKTIEINDELNERLAEIAEAENRAPGVILAEAIIQYSDRVFRQKID